MIADRLRAAILQAAISGKLTDQRPEDGTATELLEQIAAERDTLIRAKRLRKQRRLPPVNPDEQTFTLPESWAWINLGDTIGLLSGRDLTPAQYTDRPAGIPYITGASNFLDGSLVINRWTEQPLTVARKDDLLITCKGTIGDLAVLQEPEAHIARQVMAITCLQVHRDYVAAFLEHSVATLKGQAKSMIPGISRDMLLHTPFPLPPLAEQERIVARLEEVLPLIDQLAELERERKHLDREFAKAIERAILQAAISGKLTKQHPEDGTAIELLETIKTERQQLEKAGKIKVDKKYPPSDNFRFADFPFGIPASWMWCRLGELAEIKSSKRVFATEFQTEGIPFFRGTEVGALATGSYTEPKFRITDAHYRELVAKTGKPDIGDLLLPSICADGRIWRVDTDRPFYFKDGRVLWVRFISKRPESRFVQTALKVRLLNDYESIASGTTFAELKIFILKDILVPVPPVVEQERIVRKLDNLLPLTRQVQELMS